MALRWLVLGWFLIASLAYLGGFRDYYINAFPLGLVVVSQLPWILLTAIFLVLFYSQRLKLSVPTFSLLFFSHLILIQPLVLSQQEHDIHFLSQVLVWQFLFFVLLLISLGIPRTKPTLQTVFWFFTNLLGISLVWQWQIKLNKLIQVSAQNFGIKSLQSQYFQTPFFTIPLFWIPFLMFVHLCFFAVLAQEGKNQKTENS